MQRVGFVGLGHMGAPMARRLLASGYPLTVWNRTESKAAALAVEGAVVAANPAGLAGSVDVVVTMVADPEALRAVTAGPDGVLAGAARGLTLIDMSTVGPRAARELAEECDRRGVSFVDAPVLRSVPEAETGRLLLMVGAKPEILEEHRALLETFGQVIHCGGVGSGAAMKLVANASLVGGMAVLGEVLALARAMGLAEGPTFDVVIQTPAGKILERKGDYIRSGHHEPANFPLRLAAKDSGLVGEVVEELGLTSPAIDAARRWLEKARELGLGEMDYSAVVEAIKQAGPRD